MSESFLQLELFFKSGSFRRFCFGIPLSTVEYHLEYLMEYLPENQKVYIPIN